MIDQDQSKYEVIAYRRPRQGELYFYGENVQQAGSTSDKYPRPTYIVKLRQPSVVNYAALLKPAPLTPLKVEYAGQPVLVVESWDAEGNNSTNTFYDAALAERLYGRS